MDEEYAYVPFFLVESYNCVGMPYWMVHGYVGWDVGWV